LDNVDLFPEFLSARPIFFIGGCKISGLYFAFSHFSDNFASKGQVSGAWGAAHPSPEPDRH
jgi:hypothetical protein